VELQSRLKELGDKGLGVAAISYDRPEILADFSRRRGITFPLLSDAGSATIKAFGLLNTLAEDAVGPDKDDPAVAVDVHTFVAAAGVAPDPARIGMAFPGTLILDRQGRVTSRFFEDLYIERNTVSSILMKLGGTGRSVTGAKVSTAQLEVTTYPSDPAVAPGNRFMLALNIEPHPGVHVYAPGATSYRVIALTIAPQPLVRVLPLKYPASETYFFKPLKERVPVYRKPFTLLQELVLEGTPEAQKALRGRESLTLTGTLDYQACDDTLCFTPASVPLSWTLTLRPLVFERPNRPQ
jgi:AhpC/TSA family/Disulphide bond corrector protein DsbC